MARKKGRNKSARDRRPVFTTVDGIPEWAASYLMYGDGSGMEEDDVRECDKYEEQLLADGLRLVCPDDREEPSFDSWPAFGLACDTRTWIAEELPGPVWLRVWAGSGDEPAVSILYEDARPRDIRPYATRLKRRLEAEGRERVRADIMAGERARRMFFSERADKGVDRDEEKA